MAQEIDIFSRADPAVDGYRKSAGQRIPDFGALKSHNHLVRCAQHVEIKRRGIVWWMVLWALHILGRIHRVRQDQQGFSGSETTNHQPSTKNHSYHRAHRVAQRKTQGILTTNHAPAAWARHSAVATPFAQLTRSLRKADRYRLRVRPAPAAWARHSAVATPFAQLTRSLRKADRYRLRVRPAPSAWARHSAILSSSFNPLALAIPYSDRDEVVPAFTLIGYSVRWQCDCLG